MFLLRPALLRRDQPETGEHFHPGGAGVPPIQERQDGPQCLEDIDILFAGRDNKTAGSGEEFGAIPTSEATRDFLFDFHHSNIPLGEVVVKWHFKIVWGGLNPLKLQRTWRADLQVRWMDQRI